MHKRKVDDKVPKRHHYIPVFYLKRWAVDGKIYRFSKPCPGKFLARQIGPSATGFVDNLYALKGLSAELAQQVEQNFLSPADNDAAIALRMLHKELPLNWTDSTRTAWARFLFGLLVRMPEHIEQFKARYSEEFLRVSGLDAEKNLTQRTEEMPATISDLLNEVDPALIDRNAIIAWAETVNKSAAINFIMNLDWSVLELGKAHHNLLCSDRPYVMTNGLVGANSHICLPISPTKLFLASQDKTFRPRLCALPPDRIAKAVNYSVVGQSIKYVFSKDLKQAEYIMKRMSTLPAPTFFKKGYMDLEEA